MTAHFLDTCTPAGCRLPDSRGGWKSSASYDPISALEVRTTIIHFLAEVSVYDDWLRLSNSGSMRKHLWPRCSGWDDRRELVHFGEANKYDIRNACFGGFLRAILSLKGVTRCRTSHHHVFPVWRIETGQKFCSFCRYVIQVQYISMNQASLASRLYLLPEKFFGLLQRCAPFHEDCQGKRSSVQVYLQLFQILDFMFCNLFIPTIFQEHG